MQEDHFVKIAGPENETIDVITKYSLHNLHIDENFNIEDRISILFYSNKIIIKAILKGVSHTLHESVDPDINYFKGHLIKNIRSSIVNKKSWRHYIVDDKNNLQIVNL